MKPMYCPACGARMIYDPSYGYDDGERAVMVQALCPGCLLAGPCEYSRTERGAAIKAGRAMRAICRAVEERIAKARIDGRFDGVRKGENNTARRVYWMLLNSRMTRMQITERMRREAEL